MCCNCLNISYLGSGAVRLSVICARDLSILHSVLQLIVMLTNYLDLVHMFFCQIGKED